MRPDALTLVHQIREISYLQKLEGHIYDELSKQINSVEVKNVVDYNDLYHSNQQVFYGSLRGWYELDTINSSDWSPMELGYFCRLQSYLRKLLKTSKLLPSLTYLFWQYSLGKYPEQGLRQQLSSLYPSYAEAHFKAVEALREIKSQRCNFSD